MVNRQNVISDRMQSMSKYDAELSTKIEDVKQYFAKELEDFRNVVLRYAVSCSILFGHLHIIIYLKLYMQTTK